MFPTDERGCLIIAEVAQAHDGSLGLAHAFIDAVAGAGAGVVKFQTHIAEAESTRSEPWRIKFSPQDETRFDYWRRMEWSEEQWRGLKAHADERGLVFMSSPFSVEAVDLLTRIGVNLWKIASGEMFDRPVLDRVLATGRALIVSTGLASSDEVDALVETLRPHPAPWALLQCTTAYPCPPEQIGLNVIEEWQRRYGCPVGLSDHSGTIFPGLAAATMGACAVEVHVTLSRQMYGPDVPASVTPEELAELVQGVRFIDRALAHPVDKGILTPTQLHSRGVFLKSLVFAADLPAGTELRPEHVATKKAGRGVPPERVGEIVGKRLLAAVERDQPLAAGMLEGWE